MRLDVTALYAEINRLEALVSEQARDIARLVEAGGALYRAMMVYAQPDPLVTGTPEHLADVQAAHDLWIAMLKSQVVKDAYSAALAARGGED